MLVTTKEERSMTKVAAGITTSLDGYITGPNDGPGRGLGDCGERLHYWVFGGPWSYDEEARGEATGADKEVLDGAIARVGAVVGGRNTYEAADTWKSCRSRSRRSCWAAGSVCSTTSTRG